MGMDGEVYPVSEATIRRMHADPPLVLQLFSDQAAVEEARKPAVNRAVERGWGLLVSVD